MTDLVSVLNEKGIEYKTTNNPTEILVKCTSGLHEDSRPSLSYNMDRNVFHCFSCGFNGGSIKFLQSIGITEKLQIESKQEYRILKLKRKLQSIKNIDNMKLPNASSKVAWDFNGIPKEILAEFNAFVTTDMELENYISIPVYQFKRLKFIDARKRVSDIKGPKYLRKPASVAVSEVLFPIDKINRTNSVILVEGMYDMLNLWQYGVRNVLCIFGTQNFGKKKLELLDKIGVHKVSLMMDGDEAGRIATSKLSILLEQNDILVNKIYLQPHEDPGSLSEEKIQYYLTRTE